MRNSSRRRGACAAQRSIVRAIAEVLETRRLLSGPEVVPPPTPNEFNSPDGHFEFELEQKLVYDFTAPLNVPKSAQFLTNLLTGEQIPASQMDETWPGWTEDHEDFTFNTHGSGASPTFTGVPHTLPDGWYESVLLANQTSSGSGPLAEDYSSTFFALTADADHSGSVEGDDYFYLDSNAQQQLPGYHNGDFNYDSAITQADYDLLSANMGKVLIPPPTAPNSVDTMMDGPNSIFVMWSLPEAIDADGVRIYRSTDGGVNYTLRHTIEGTEINAWTDDGLEEGTKYSYRIRAFTEAAGNSITSNESPSVTNLPAPDQVFASGVTSESLFLNWQDNSTNESAYEIWMQTGGVGDFVMIAELTGFVHGELDTPVYEINGLTPGTTYSFRIRAVTPAADSMFSPTYSVTPGAPTAPTGLWVGQFSSTELGLSWQDNSEDESSFLVERSPDGVTGWTTIGQAEPDATTFLDASLSHGTTYHYRVSAVNQLGASTSESDENSTLGVLPAPTNLSVTATSTETVSLSWTLSPAGQAPW